MPCDNARTKSIRLKTAPDGVLQLPSVFCDPKGDARFILPTPKAFLKDLAIKYLIEHEPLRYDSFEYPTRAFFGAHLKPGDVVGEKTLADILDSAGWKIDSQELVEKSQMFTCHRKSNSGP